MKEGSVMTPAEIEWMRFEDGEGHKPRNRGNHGKSWLKVKEADFPLGGPRRESSSC